MQPAKIKEVKTSYNEAFLPNHDPGWEVSCLTDFARISSVTEQEFRTPDFQCFLWELDDIASIGPGNSVTVPGAYQDVEIIEVLWQLKQW